MTTYSEAATARAMAGIQDMHTASSRSNCLELHTLVVEYCQTLLESEAIDDRQWKALLNLANMALANWRPTKGQGDQQPHPALQTER